jgi:Holliday junction resolvasome RuvABC endonuclease subunit
MSKISRLRNLDLPTSFCAIDASTNSLAFAYFVDGNLLHWGKIKYQGNNVYEKIADTSHKTVAFFNSFPVDVIVIEDTIFANSPKTAAQLAKCQGALLAAASMAGVKAVYAVSPVAWQNYVGTRLLNQQEKDEIKNTTPGKSNSWYKTREREIRKNRTIATMNERFDIGNSDNDIADAIGIGVYSMENWTKVVGSNNA